MAADTRRASGAAATGGGLISEVGNQRIGLDHFARSGESLATAAREGRLHRNFQGYTDDACPTLIDLGPSSLSRLPQGYAQNTTATPVYERLVDAGKLATARGIALSDEDRARAWVMERLMCDFAISGEEVVRRFGSLGEIIVVEAGVVAGEDPQLLVRQGDGFTVPREGQIPTAFRRRAFRSVSCVGECTAFGGGLSDRQG